MAKVTKEDIKAGFEAYAIGFISDGRRYEGCQPVKIRFTDGVFNEENKCLAVEVLTDNAFGFSKGDGTEAIFPGDNGIDGYAYDGRQCQVFTTEEESQAFIDLCAGRNPNWVDADGNYHEPERDWFDDWDYD